MKKYHVMTAVILLLTITSIQATTIRRNDLRETACSCIGVYARFSFEVKDGAFAHVKVINSSSNVKCDKWYSEVLSSIAANHPNDVTGIGVFGQTAKDKTMTYKQCLKTDKIELDNYWHIEDITIDFQKVNQVLE